MDKKYLNTSEVSHLFQVSCMTIDAWRKKGLIPFIKIGHTVRFDADQIHEFLMNRVPPKTQPENKRGQTDAK